MGFFDGGFGGIVSGVLGALGGAAGSALDAAHDRDLARMNQNWQKEVYQNQLQWKAADARKAGLHPLAAIGGGAYSASNVASSPSSSYAGALGKLGEGIGDAFTAYMNKDEIAAEKAKADNKFNKEMDLLDAQIQEIRARTRESLNRSLSYSRPMASGRELLGGQTDSSPNPVSDLSGIPGVSVTPAEEINGSAFGRENYDINLSSEAQQLLGDELGQVYNGLRKATRENRGSYFDPKTGYLFLFDRHSGYWYIPRSGGGGA